MSATRIDPDVEERIRRALHALADAHPVGPGRAPGDSSSGSRRRWMLAAAAAVLLGGLAGLVVAVRGDDGDEPSVTTPPVTVATTTPAPTTTPAEDVNRLILPDADGDEPIDPSTLRFPEPIPDGQAAFLDDPSLPPPQLDEGDDTPILRVPADPTPIGEQPDNVGIVAMDGPDFLMRGVVLDLPGELVEFEITGRPVEVGVEGARYGDEDEGVIYLPLDDGVRLIAPDDFLSFGSGGPFIEPGALLGIVSTIGTRPLDELDDLPGIYALDGTIDGESVGPRFSEQDSVPVVHDRDAGLPDAFVTLQGLTEPPTQFELLAIAQWLARGRVEGAEAGDVSFEVGSDLYLELVSPVDLVILSSPRGLGDHLDSIAVMPIDDLE